MENLFEPRAYVNRYMDGKCGEKPRRKVVESTFTNFLHQISISLLRFNVHVSWIVGRNALSRNDLFVECLQPEITLLQQ